MAETLFTYNSELQKSFWNPEFEIKNRKGERPPSSRSPVTSVGRPLWSLNHDRQCRSLGTGHPQEPALNAVKRVPLPAWT